MPSLSPAVNRLPQLSVIVPLRERPSFARTLEGLLVQEAVDAADFEVLVVDAMGVHDWSEALTAAGERRPTLQLRYLRVDSTESRAKQLNAALGHARGELVLLLADDFAPCPRLLAEHLGAHRQDPAEELVAIGPGLFPDNPDTNPFMRWLEDSGELFGVSFTRPDLRLPPDYFYMANTSLKRSFLHRAGRFDEDFPYDAMDDWEMGQRLSALGMRNAYLPGAVATHNHPLLFDERCRAMRLAGESSAILDTKRSAPGPWEAIYAQAKVPYSVRKNETREQRYRRILARHWMEGYRARMCRFVPAWSGRKNNDTLFHNNNGA